MLSVFQFFFLSVRHIMFPQFLVIAVLCKCVMAAYIKLILEYDKWWIPLIPFSQHYSRVYEWYCVKLPVSIILLLLELNFYYTCCLFPFIEFIVLQVYCLKREWEIFEKGNMFLYMLVPGYKYIILGKEVYDEFREQRSKRADSASVNTGERSSES